MVVALPDGTTLYQNEADTEFESASLYKLGIMVEVYRQRDTGELSFDDLVTLYPGYFLEDDSVYGYDGDAYDQIPVGTLLDNMITLSSNVAATALLDVVGTDNVNATMESLGLDHTKILWYPVAGGDAPSPYLTASASPGRQSGTLLSLNTPLAPRGSDSHANVDGAYNVTTPDDVATLFEMLVDGTVVSADASAEMLDLLSEQQINDRLPAGVPDGTRVAHKTGDLDNSVHDVGVIYAPNGPIVVVVLSDEVENREDVVEFIRQVAQLAYGAESP
ncbi:MAG: serine hydrolase [Nitrolancea sp.]